MVAESTQPDAPTKPRRRLTPEQARALALKSAAARKSHLGRPSVITPETLDAITRRIAKGLTEEEAVVLTDLQWGTWSRWKGRRQNDESFAALLSRAKANRVESLMDRIEGAEKGWQAPAWLLERVYPRFQQQRGPEVQVNAQVVQLLESVNTARQSHSFAKDAKAPKQVKG